MSTTTPLHRAPRPGLPRDPSADVAILKATLRLFAERGFDGVTFEEVAAAAGVARTTVYRRWSSKAELVAEAVATQRGEPELKLAAEPKPTVALRRDLVEALAATLAAPGFRDVIARLIGSLPDHPELMSIYWRNYLEPRRRAVTRLLERARDEGAIRPDADLEILLDLIGGAVMHQLLIRPGAQSGADLAAYLERVLRELEANQA